MSKMIATKKLTSIALAVATLFGGAAVSSTAFAAADTNKANDITISAQGRKDGDVDRTVNVNGRKFTAYKLGSYENVRFETVGEGNAAYKRVKGYDLTSTDNAKLSAALKPVVTETTGEGKAAKTTVKAKWNKRIRLDGEGNLEFIGDSANLSPVEFVAKYFYGQADDVYGNDHANNAEMRQFANSLKAAGFTAAAQTTGADGEARFDLADDEAGLYLITEDADSANHDADHSGETISRAMVIGTAFKDGDEYVNKVSSVRAGNGADDANATDVTVGELKIKADKVVIVKDVQGDDRLVGLGSVRNFQIDTNVPNYTTDYQDWDGKVPSFTVNDNPTDNLDVTKAATNVISNIKVQANTGKDGAFEDVDAAKYTVKLLDATPDVNDFTVSLNDPREFSGKQIRVTYTGVVTSVLLDKTSNTASVDYSNDPYSESHVETIHNPEEKLYQADLDLTKVNFKDNAAVLNGAEFKVYKDGSDQPVLWKASGANFYEAKDGTETGRTDTITFGENVQLKGLAADADSTDADGVSYRFVETKAPEGFLLGKDATPVEFTVTLTPQWKDGSSSDTGKSLAGVNYVVNAGKFTNFLDATGNISMDVAKQTAGALRTKDGTVYAAAEKVENTDDLADLPKTGADILTYLAVSVAALVLGGGLMVAANKRRQAAK